MARRGLLAPPLPAIALALFLLATGPVPAGARAGPGEEPPSSPPSQYRGPADEVRGRRSPPTEAGPIPGGGNEPAEGKDRWEFWFEFEKDSLLRAALGRPRVGAAEDPVPPGTTARAPSPLTPADLGDRLLPALRVALLDPVPSVRAAAARALGNAGDHRSLPVLLSELRGGEVEGRRAAALALGSLGGPGAVAALGEAMLRDPDEETRSRAAFALGLAGDPAATALLREDLGRLLADPANRFDFAADLVVSLGLSGERTEAPLLQKILLSGEIRDWRVHSAAAWALAAIGDPAALPALLLVLREAHDPRVRRAAVLALGRFPGDGAAAPLREVLSSDPDATARGLAAVSLARVDGPGCFPWIAPFTETKHPRTTRGFAALALGLSGDSARAGPLLLDLLALRSEDSMRGAAAVGLGLLRYGPAAGALAALAVDPSASPDLRGHALLAIALTGNSSAPALLRGALREERHDGVLRGAALGAGVLPFPGSDLLLLQALDDSPDPTVRGAALLGLGLAADRGALPFLADRALDLEARDPLSRLQAVLALGQLALGGKLPPLSRISAGAGWHRLTPAAESVTRGF